MALSLDENPNRIGIGKLRSSRRPLQNKSLQTPHIFDIRPLRTNTVPRPVQPRFIRHDAPLYISGRQEFNEPGNGPIFLFRTKQYDTVDKEIARQFHT